MVKLVHACHLFCISFQLSFQFDTYSVDNAKYGHNKHTLHYILVAPDLENVDVVCTL